MTILAVLLGYLHLVAVASAVVQPVVHTSLGTIAGTRVTFLNKEINQFLGIPYAEPPVGNLRFQKPQPVRPWNGMYNATQFSDQCAQFTLTRQKPPWVSENVMSEDCLYLNIWSPVTDNESDGFGSTPVLVWVYAGGFVVGSADLPITDGRPFAAEGDVVLVSFNYRLTAFGFFNLGTEDAPGNQGMWDQNMALHWVQTHIKYFGGNPNQITIYGESAGSISVGLHLLSPNSDGLFQRAILESGAPTRDNLILDSNVIKNHSLEFARHVGCLDTECGSTKVNLQRTAQCLRELCTQEMLDAVNQFLHETSFNVLWPMYGDDFLPAGKPRHITVDIVIGNVAKEGAVLLPFADPRFVPILFGEQITVDEARKMWLSRTALLLESDETDLLDFHFGNLQNSDTKAAFDSLANLSGEGFMVCPTSMFAEFAAKSKRSVYFYLFNHRPSQTPWPERAGVPHFEDVQFFFGAPLLHPENYQPEEVDFSRDLLRIFASFARTGIPTAPGISSWPVYSAEHPVHVELKPGNFTTNCVIPVHDIACQLWKRHVRIN